MNKASHILVVASGDQGQSTKSLTQDVLNQLQGDDTKITVMAPDQSQIEGYAGITVSQKSMTPSNNPLVRWYRALAFCCCVIFARLRYGEISSVLLTSQPSASYPVFFLRNLLKYQVVQLISQPVSWTPKNGLCLTKADRVFYLQSMRESMLEAIACQWKECPNTTAHQQAQDIIQSERYTPFKMGYIYVDQPMQEENSLKRVFCETQTRNLAHLLDALAHIRKENRPAIYLKETGANIHKNTDIKHQSTLLGCQRCEEDVQWAPGNIYLALPGNLDNERQVLKALSTGMCVILPADGSFWDLALSNQVNCLKYKPYDMSSLKEKLEQVKTNPVALQSIAKAGAHIAHGYRADKCYTSIISALTNRSTTEQHHD
ncbi:hypothetical protein [Vibrio nigripulchritudo]|uniref:hypothetical protein n=1 Tax=Vibrio nigripulchritudo TaxID=28173 RepID=UPI0003B22F04|nr:hypothetical protein [Vibrio nigripulchritudo]CCN72658.1 conserved hypothetical protein [Vibrio nigripulchritudo SFn118]